MKRLHEILSEYGKSNTVPFHMPGHKRRADILPDWNPWQMDFTEVEGLDNMHCAEGIIKDAQAELALVYGVDASYFMVNGSTGGILAAISSCVKHGDSIVVARNCHKSVYNAMYLNELKPVYVYPTLIEEWEISGGISPEEVRQAIFANPEVKAVVITSPTYEGIVSDVEAIAKIAHEHNIPLIVDEAHGAHLKLMENSPKSAVDCGADIVIQSFHKLLPALTQTAVLHFNSKIVDRGRLENYLGIYQTSSPSYLFMASMDWALDFMQSEKGRCLAKEYWKELNIFKEKCHSLKKLCIMEEDIVGKNEVFGFDRTKLVVSTTCGSIPGSVLEEKLLKEFKIQAEMSKGSNVLLMTSVVDGAEVFERLYAALEKMDGKLVQEQDTQPGADCGEDSKKGTSRVTNEKTALSYYATVTLTSYEAVNAKQEQVSAEDAVGKISAEYIYLYPPGIPIVVPGEMITQELYDIILYYKENYFGEGATSNRRLQGMQDKSMNTLLVVDNLEEK
ncbi:MAG: aminotransferase class V-fold PLP-dependent enzyme [Lachnospiraceae bacterium]|nr:aminotransferase class V-fold PLP-dependent enzyme [Lachnospiraceae bacterium]